MSDFRPDTLREQAANVIDVYLQDRTGYGTEIADLLIDGPLKPFLDEFERLETVVSRRSIQDRVETETKRVRPVEPVTDAVQPTVGQIIDALGIKTTIQPNELVSSAVVLLTVIEEDGTPRLSTLWPPGMLWLTRIGMFRQAELSESRLANE